MTNKQHENANCLNMYSSDQNSSHDSGSNMNSRQKHRNTNLQKKFGQLTPKRKKLTHMLKIPY